MSESNNSSLQAIYRYSLDYLTSLPGKHYPQQGRNKELYHEATECLRTYLNERFELDMQNRTEAEWQRVSRLLKGPACLFEEIRKIFSEHEQIHTGEYWPTKKEAYEFPKRCQSILQNLAPSSA